jgi:hypothetical protein
VDGSAGDLDRRVRLAAFRFLTEQIQLHGEVLSRTLLATGFPFDSRRVPLIGPSRGSSRGEAGAISVGKGK